MLSKDLKRIFERNFAKSKILVFITKYCRASIKNESVSQKGAMEENLKGANN